MAHIKITKGLDIPIKGKPNGSVCPLVPRGGTSFSPKLMSLNLKPFEEIKLRLLAKPGEAVKVGTPLAEDKNCPGRMFVSPACGVVKEVRRGLKRRLLDVVIEADPQENFQEFPPLNPSHASREEIINRLKAGGLFAHIRSRPFNLLADPHKMPRNIFVKALESALFTPPAELQVEGQESAFQAGLTALSKLTSGQVHLIYRQDCLSKAFLEAKDVQKHTAEGPYPVSNHSLHIEKIDPIRSAEDCVWTLNVRQVVAIGHLLSTGRYFNEKIIGIGGTGILPDQTGYFRVKEGFPISGLLIGRIQKGWVRLISGDPLLGEKVEEGDFLGFYHDVFCAIPENTHREFLHFFRLGLDKYTFSKAYLSGHFNPSGHEYDFTTNQHGEHRAFIDSTLYDEVMPLRIPTMLLVKAVMAEDFDLAVDLGLLEVDSEDFALPSFVCPSKIEMTDIIKSGLKTFAKEALASTLSI